MPKFIYQIIITTILVSKSAASAVNETNSTDYKIIPICPKNLSLSANVHIFLLKLIGAQYGSESSANSTGLRWCFNKRSPKLSDSAEDGGYFVTPKNFRQGEYFETTT